MDGAIMYGKPDRIPPLWLHGIMEMEMEFLHNALQGAEIDKEFIYLPYQRFGIRFVAYDYYLIFFNYDRGFCSFSIFVGERYGASLNGGKSMVAFGEIKD